MLEPNAHALGRRRNTAPRLNPQSVSNLSAGTATTKLKRHRVQERCEHVGSP